MNNEPLVNKSVVKSAQSFSQIVWSAYRKGWFEVTYKLGNECVTELPGGFNPFGHDVRDLVGNDVDVPIGGYRFIEVRGFLFLNEDGSYRYEINYILGEQTCDWDFPSGLMSLTIPARQE